jgi:KaiC/GvpD/RAD55 family RecA-like ATPase
MVKAEIIKRSPLRILEKTTHGGLGPGNVGVIAARKGVGKTAFLVHLATDRLLQGQHVIHVSFAGKTDHIIDWYEDIFREIALRYDLEGEMRLHDEAVRNRVVMNFNQEGVRIDQVAASIRAMIEQGHFNADLIVVDGFDFARGDSAALRTFRDFAAEMGVELWFSASVPESGMPRQHGQRPLILEPFLSDIAIVVVLRPEGGVLRLELVKDHEFPVPEDLHLRLDPKILLICE